MADHQEYYETTFLAYFPEYPVGENLLMVDMIYGEKFADGLMDDKDETWRNFIRQIEKTKRLYEAERNKDQMP